MWELMLITMKFFQGAGNATDVFDGGNGWMDPFFSPRMQVFGYTPNVVLSNLNVTCVNYEIRLLSRPLLQILLGMVQVLILGNISRRITNYSKLVKNLAKQSGPEDPAEVKCSACNCRNCRK